MNIDQIQSIIERTAEEFGVCPRDIISTGGSRPVSAARGVVAFLLRDELSTAQIGSLLGRRNHQYKRSSIKRVYERSNKDHAYFVRVMKLGEEFGVGWS